MVDPEMMRRVVPENVRIRPVRRLRNTYRICVSELAANEKVSIPSISPDVMISRSQAPHYKILNHARAKGLHCIGRPRSTPEGPC